jgi:hypothetical protein
VAVPGGDPGPGGVHRLVTPGPGFFVMRRIVQAGANERSWVVNPLVEGALEVLFLADLDRAESGPEDRGVDGGFRVNVGVGVGGAWQAAESEHACGPAK